MPKHPTNRSRPMLHHYDDSDQRADTAFLVGARFGREQERAEIIRLLEDAILPVKQIRWEREIYVNDGLRDAISLLRGEKK